MPSNGPAVVHPARPRSAASAALLLWLTAMLAGGCASVGEVAVGDDAPGNVRRCAELFGAVERAVLRHEVRDDEAHVLEGYPWYRSSRFLASFRDEVHGDRLDQWLRLMAGLDARGRYHELANLPESARRQLGGGLAGRLAACRRDLVTYDRDRPGRVADIRAAAPVPDAYLEWRRALGLYPVSGWFVLAGVEDWHDEVKARFATQPVFDTGRAYAPPDAAGPEPDRVRAILDEAAGNPLAIPLPDRVQASYLLRAFAPAWRIETKGDYDRPGVPVSRDGRFGVEPAAVVYGRVSHTRWRERSLLQLNYLVWFSERPRTGAFDMLGGRLDGVWWRVTLDSDGRPLLYDSMHACGCYHMAFPGVRLAAREARGGLHEPLLVPRRAPAGAGRMTLFLESGTHYLVGLAAGAATGDARRYELRGYHELRSGPGPRGLFGQDGIVPGTDRREEIFFWPTGVRAPGAMRQWGTHATAFVGERHFDDARFIERYFRPVDGEAEP